MTLDLKCLTQRINHCKSCKSQNVLFILGRALEVHIPEVTSQTPLSSAVILFSLLRFSDAEVRIYKGVSHLYLPWTLLKVIPLYLTLTSAWLLLELGTGRTCAPTNIDHKSPIRQQVSKRRLQKHRCMIIGMMKLWESYCSLSGSHSPVNGSALWETVWL